MTTLIEQLRADAMKARLDRARVAADLLVTLVSEASMVGKNDGGREPTDKEVIKAVNRFHDGVVVNIAALEKDASTSTDPKKAANLEKLREEKRILQGYIPEQPAQFTEAELQAEINKLVDGLAEKSPKQVGAVMKELNAQFSGRYDGALAGKLVKAALTPAK